MLRAGGSGCLSSAAHVPEALWHMPWRQLMHLLCPRAAHAGFSLEAAIGCDLWTLFVPVGDVEAAMVDTNAALFCRQPFSVVAMQAPSSGAADSAGAAGTAGAQGRRIRLSFRPASHGVRSPGSPLVHAPSFVSGSLGACRHDPSAPSADVWFAVLAPAAAEEAGSSCSPGCVDLSSRGRLSRASSSPDAVQASRLSFGMPAAGRSLSFTVPSSPVGQELVFADVKLVRRAWAVLY